MVPMFCYFFLMLFFFCYLKWMIYLVVEWVHVCVIIKRREADPAETYALVIFFENEPPQNIIYKIIMKLTHHGLKTKLNDLLGTKNCLTFFSTLKIKQKLPKHEEL